MPNIYTGSVEYTAVTAWAASTAYVSTSNGGRGDYRRQLAAPTVGNERVFRCTTSGTSLTAEPTWVLTKNSTTTETAGPVWTECTGQELDQTAALWKAPHAALENAFAWGAAGDNFYVSHDHAQTRATALTLTSPGTDAAPCNVTCVNATTGSSLPPVSADLRTTGTISTTGASNVTPGGIIGEMYGLSIQVGSAANTANIVAAAGFICKFKSCVINLNNTGSSTIAWDTTQSQGRIEFDNTPVVFGAVGQSMSVSSKFIWKNTVSAVQGTIPTTLFTEVIIRARDLVLLERVDLTAMVSGKTIVGVMTRPSKFILKDCSLAAGVTIAAASTTFLSAETYVARSDASGTNYREEKYSFLGNHVAETVIIKTGGASNGTTGLSRKITVVVSAKWPVPFEMVPLAIWNDTTAANVTVTVEGLQDPRTSTVLPNNDDIWMEIGYLGSASSTLGTGNTGTKADRLAAGTALTASTQAWDSLVTARVNSEIIAALGTARKVASNAGRVFICTATGTCAASEPAGYAAAADGGAVVDGSATFTAAVRFNLAITLSAPQPGQKGVVYVTPKAAKASGIYYLDPKPVLS